MEGTGRWVFGGVFVLVAILGLALASAAKDNVMYVVGLVVFAFAVLFVFGLMQRTFDEKGAGGGDGH
jgi:galactitol-specific phosphotransferase system IIC component